MDKNHQKSEDPEIPSSQFPEIERLIQTEDFEKINKNFMAAYAELEKISKSATGLKKSQEARKAMKAIESVMDLFRELLKLKYKMSEEGAGGGVETPQKKK